MHRAGRPLDRLSVGGPSVRAPSSVLRRLWSTVCEIEFATAPTLWGRRRLRGVGSRKRPLALGELRTAPEIGSVGTPEARDGLVAATRTVRADDPARREVRKAVLDAGRVVGELDGRSGFGGGPAHLAGHRRSPKGAFDLAKLAAFGLGTIGMGNDQTRPRPSHFWQHPRVRKSRSRAVVVQPRCPVPAHAPQGSSRMTFRRLSWSVLMRASSAGGVARVAASRSRSGKRNSIACSPRSRSRSQSGNTKQPRALKMRVDEGAALGVEYPSTGPA